MEEYVTVKIVERKQNYKKNFSHYNRIKEGHRSQEKEYRQSK